MIYFYFNIDSPIKVKKYWQKIHFAIDKKISKNKNFSMQFDTNSINKILQFQLDTNITGEHHAGPKLHITVLCFSFYISIYDGRHWNDDTDDWYTDEEIEEENNMDR